MFIDNAGIRRRGKVEAGIERFGVMRALNAISRADVVLLVTEAAEVMNAQDMHIAGYIHEALKGVVVVVNKWDLARDLGKEKAQCTREIQQKLKFFPGVPIVFASAQFKQGIDQVLSAARGVYQERQKRLATPLLNEEIGRILAAHPPASVKGKQLKRPAQGARVTGHGFCLFPCAVHLAPWAIFNLLHYSKQTCRHVETRAIQFNTLVVE